MPDAEIVARFLAGESVQALGVVYNVDMDAIRTRLRNAGVAKRQPKEAQSLMRKHQRERQEREIVKTVTHCKGCGKLLVRGEHEPPSKWLGRIACNHRCFADMRIAQSSEAIGEKDCIVCGKPLVRRSGEKSTHWRKRLTCGRKCQIEGMVSRTAEMHQLSGNTSIELATYAALDALRVRHERQFRIGWYVVDAYLPESRTVIEVQGDYWHGNPAVYPGAPIDKRMAQGMARDKRRFSYLRKHGYTVIEFWEKDIKERGAAALLEEIGLKPAA